MDKEEKEKFTGMMYQLVGIRYSTEKILIRKGFSIEIINEALEKGYIEYLGENDVGERLYRITNDGKKFLQ